VANIHTALKTCYDLLKAEDTAIVDPWAGVTVKTFFMYVFDREGIENLPLFLNSSIYAISHFKYTVDCSGEWKKLIMDKLSE
jgi:hypothetical protein